MGVKEVRSRAMAKQPNVMAKVRIRSLPEWGRPSLIAVFKLWAAQKTGVPE
jgi:hypothetical protein